MRLLISSASQLGQIYLLELACNKLIIKLPEPELGRGSSVEWVVASRKWGISSRVTTASFIKMESCRQRQHREEATWYGRPPKIQLCRPLQTNRSTLLITAPHRQRWGSNLRMHRCVGSHWDATGVILLRMLMQDVGQLSAHGSIVIGHTLCEGFTQEL